MNKWLHYFEIYERHFARYKDTEVSILEIGVYQGGSLNMWKQYFGDKAKIFAIDINPSCKQFETERVKIYIGSQEDKDFLEKIKNEIPKLDIIIDDGGHYNSQQIVTFEGLFDHIKEDGIYLCEDTHTSYWKDYGGGYKKKSTFIEYTKNLIDKVNAWHSQSLNLKVSHFTKSIYSLHYYDSIVVIEKRIINEPKSRVTGQPIINPDEFSADDTRNLSIKDNIFDKLLKYFKNGKYYS